MKKWIVLGVVGLAAQTPVFGMSVGAHVSPHVSPHVTPHVSEVAPHESVAVAHESRTIQSDVATQTALRAAAAGHVQSASMPEMETEEDTDEHFVWWMLGVFAVLMAFLGLAYLRD